MRIHAKTRMTPDALLVLQFLSCYIGIPSGSYGDNIDRSILRPQRVETEMLPGVGDSGEQSLIGFGSIHSSPASMPDAATLV